MHSARNSRSNMKEQDFDRKFKILMLGNAMVGKTSFLGQYTHGIFRDATTSTVGMELTYKAVVRNDKKIKLEIWDTGKVLEIAFSVMSARKHLSRY